MKIDGSVALVTGANRGLGQVFARELVARGAAKVYGAARHPDAVTGPGVTPVALDITDPVRVAEVAHQCADVSLLVNNAGVLKYSTFIDAPSLDAARTEMETNYFGTLSMCRAFAPVLSANGVPVEGIALLAGHERSATTEAVYRHEIRPALTQGAEVMDKIFG